MQMVFVHNTSSLFVLTFSEFEHQETAPQENHNPDTCCHKTIVHYRFWDIPSSGQDCTQRFCREGERQDIADVLEYVMHPLHWPADAWWWRTWTSAQSKIYLPLTEFKALFCVKIYFYFVALNSKV
jgi:hypothetical protein